MASPPPPVKHANPYWVNLHIGQVIFGALAALLTYDLIQRFGAEEEMSMTTFLEAAGLVILTLGFFFIYLPNMYRHGLMPDYSLKCKFCNGPVNRYSEFCEHCGGDLIAETLLINCPKCEIELYEGTKHCPECGAKILQKGGKKSGKGKKKDRSPEQEQAEGWDTPLDAVGPKPWEK
ncbi:MAG TPA: zinc ribbon domain-containing protein [Candidatus Thermoplasmatota archaeon]|nr:zinc ribbon domain-containing protein [Candidatus Thermoplasmatota archaeon]